MSRRIITRSVVGFLGLLLGGLLAACAPSDSVRPSIVVTTNILGDVVTEIVGDQADVTVLMKPQADPHSFEISAQEAATLRTADLVVSNGLGLEEGLSKHLDSAEADGTEVFAAGEHITVLDYTAGSDTPDPHFWTDPDQMVLVVDALSERLGKLEEIDKDRLKTNIGRYRQQLSQLSHDMEQSFSSIPRSERALVTNHHVFGYLARRFDFTLVGAVIPSGTTLAAPSAADLSSLSKAIERYAVPTIFAESSQPDRLMKVLAQEAGISVRIQQLFTESLSFPGEGADTYLTMMRTNTERITNGLAPDAEPRH